ncbi:MAG: toll/interleukin-1 receptor domain-containing protein [Chloroflexota bacterium]
MSGYMSLFVSYSSKDKDVVTDKISLKLIAKGIDVFWDVLSLRFGEKWEEQLYKELENREGLVLVVTENSLKSEWVAKEYNYFRSNGKPVFACYLDDPKVLRENEELREVIEDWNLDEWQVARFHTPEAYEIQFPKLLSNIFEASKSTESVENSTTAKEVSELTLTDIKDYFDSIGILRPVAGIIALLLIGLPAGWIAIIVGAFAWIFRKPKPKFNIQETLLPTDPTDIELYNAGLKEKYNGNLDTAADLWKGLLTRSPNFNNGILKKDYDSLMTDLKPIEIQRLENAAYEASTAANWLHAVQIWEEIIEKDARHPDAQQELKIAQTNAMHSNLYENARRLHYQNGTESSQIAKEELRRLYEQAPYYGDPDNIAKDLGMGEKVLYAQRKVNIVNSLQSVDQAISTKKRELDNTKQKIKSLKDEVTIQSKATKIYPAGAFSLASCSLLTCGSTLLTPVAYYYREDTATTNIIFWGFLLTVIIFSFIYMRIKNNQKNIAINQLNELEKVVEAKNRQRFLLEEEINTLSQRSKQLRKQQKDIKSLSTGSVLRDNIDRLKGFWNRGNS